MGLKPCLRERLTIQLAWDELGLRTQSGRDVGQTYWPGGTAERKPKEKKDLLHKESTDGVTGAVVITSRRPVGSSALDRSSMELLTSTKALHALTIKKADIEGGIHGGKTLPEIGRPAARQA